MSYRKIEVNGNTYEYVIGKTVIKIKGLGIFPISEYGNGIGFPSLNKKGDGYEFRQTLRSHKSNDLAFNVTPKIIAGIITGKKVEPIDLMVDPFETEIHGRVVYIKYNPEVYFSRKDDI